jgi:hypothetical protein
MLMPDLFLCSHVAATWEADLMSDFRKSGSRAFRCQTGRQWFGGKDRGWTFGGWKLLAVSQRAF